MRYAERIAEAEWQHGQSSRQPRRIWAVEALKPELREEEYDAAKRAVRECILFFPGAKANYDRVDMAWSDAGLAKQMDAGHALFGLRQGVSKRCKITSAPNVVEWLVQLYTLQDVASELRFFRNMGKDRPPIPDIRPAKRIVLHVLHGMADYYADCDAGLVNWKAA